MKILVVDNYDSFVFNLVHMLRELGQADIEVVKNDRLNIDGVGQFDKILLSPGPGLPKDAGLMPEIINRYKDSKSILGICLGHQAIAESFLCPLRNLEIPLHGVASQMVVTKQDYLFKDIPNGFIGGHYHSWVVGSNPSADLEVLAVDKQDNIMAIRHRHFDLRGLQFHPESILTENGKTIIKNWVNNTKTS